MTDEADTIDAGIAAVLDRGLAAATAAVEDYAPNAPVALQNEAVVRVASRLYDQSGAEGRGGNPMILSAAAFLLAPYRSSRVAKSSGATA